MLLIEITQDKLDAEIFSVMLSDEKYMSLPDFLVKEIAWKAIEKLKEYYK